MDPDTHRTRKTTRTVYTNTPCRLSFSSLDAATEGLAHTYSQSTKLFTGPETDIPEGSRIVVTRSTGEVSEWERSGMPAFYPTHREYMVQPYGEYT